MLSKKQLTDVCLLNDISAATCRYLSVVDNQYHCCKLNKNLKAILDKKASEIIQSLKAKGQNIDEVAIPLGDNCQGYVGGLKAIEQGYDC